MTTSLGSITIIRHINLGHKPVKDITDRAKRYRAQQNVKGPKRCVVCGSTKNLDVMHLSGDESDGASKNLAYGCRSCNAALGAAFKKIGSKIRTRQYNPSVEELEQQRRKLYAELQGRDTTSEWAKPRVKKIHALTARIEKLSSQMAYNPSSGVPTFEQYSWAVSQQRHSGEHGEAGAVIHATPKSKRTEYARRILAGVTKSRRDEVPF
jgi:hypothetical protein